MERFSTDLLRIFAFVGIIFSCGILALVLMVITNKVKDKIEDTRRKNRIKHRFDGEPIAKCWCRDCRMHDIRSGRCGLPGIGRHTPDNGFCYESDPVLREIEHGDQDS